MLGNRLCGWDGLPSVATFGEVDSREGVAGKPGGVKLPRIFECCYFWEWFHRWKVALVPQTLGSGTFEIPGVGAGLKHFSEEISVLVNHAISRPLGVRA